MLSKRCAAIAILPILLEQGVKEDGLHHGPFFFRLLC